MTDHKKIFINFRRNNTGGWASLLYERLNKLYENEVFFDEKIKSGKRWPKILVDSVKNCKLFLVVIGPDWDSPEHIDEMEQEDDWVRREIKIAIKEGKIIIPIFVNRSAKISVHSDKIKSIFDEDIFECQGHVFSGNTNSWDIGALQNDIYDEINLIAKQEKIVGIDEQTYIEHVCELNRYKQFDDLENEVAKGKKIFAVSGRDGIEVEHFAKRFLLSIGQTAEPNYLNWDNFCEILDKDPEVQYSRREGYIFKKITAFQGLELDDKNPAKTKQSLQKKLSANKTVFFCIRKGVSAKNQKSRDVAEWWKIWASLLGTQQKSNTIVLLFTIPGWSGSLKILPYGKPDIDLVQLTPFGKITKEHIINWRSERKSSLPKIEWDKKVFKLFRFGRSRSYEYVNKHLEQVLTTAEKNHAK